MEATQQATLAPASDTEALELSAQIVRARQANGYVDRDDGRDPWDRMRERVVAMAEQPDDVMEIDPEAEHRREIQRDLMADVGDRYAACRLSNFDATLPAQRRVRDALAKYCEQIRERHAKRQGLVLYGPVGTGKDHLAFAVARAAVLAGLSVKWLNGQDWFGQVRDAMDGDTSEAALIRRIAARDFAVISDPLPPIGNLTQHQATMLYRAVESRYAAGKPTIVTVNVASDGEADLRLGAATWDRLCHGAGKIKCEWPSYRVPAFEVS